MTKGMELQVFIEENIGKGYGDEFKFHSVILTTRYKGGIEGEYGPGVEVFIVLPQGFSFGMAVETKLIKSHVEFFRWLSEEFVPEFDAAIKEMDK